MYVNITISKERYEQIENFINHMLSVIGLFIFPANHIINIVLQRSIIQQLAKLFGRGMTAIKL